MISFRGIFKKRENKADDGKQDTSGERDALNVPYNPLPESASKRCLRRRVISITASAAAVILVLALSLNFLKTPDLEKHDPALTSSTAESTSGSLEMGTTLTESSAVDTEGTVSQSSQPSVLTAAATTGTVAKTTPKTTPKTTVAVTKPSSSGIKNISYTTDPNVLVSVDGYPCLPFSLYAAFAAVEEGKKEYEKGFTPPIMFTPPDYLGTGDPKCLANYAVDYFIMARWVGRVNDKEGLTEQIGIMGFERDYYERVYANGVSTTLFSWDSDMERVFSHYRRTGKLPVTDSMRHEYIRENNLTFGRTFNMYWGQAPDSETYAKAERIGCEFAEYLCKYGYDQAKYEEVVSQCIPLGTGPSSDWQVDCRDLRDIKPGVAQGRFYIKERESDHIRFVMEFDGVAYYDNGFDEVMRNQRDVDFQRPMFYNTLRREMTELKITINKEKVLEVYQKKSYLNS